MDNIDNIFANTAVFCKECGQQIKPGDRLFVYTDGIPEAQGSDTGMFGTDRMIEALNEGKDLNPEQILEKVQDTVSTFVGNVEQFDDLTMMCLEYKGFSVSRIS